MGGGFRRRSLEEEFSVVFVRPSLTSFVPNTNAPPPSTNKKIYTYMRVCDSVYVHVLCTIILRYVLPVFSQSTLQIYSWSKYRRKQTRDDKDRVTALALSIEITTVSLNVLRMSKMTMIMLLADR